MPQPGRVATGDGGDDPEFLPSLCDLRRQRRVQPVCGQVPSARHDPEVRFHPVRARRSQHAEQLRVPGLQRRQRRAHGNSSTREVHLAGGERQPHEPPQVGGQRHTHPRHAPLVRERAAHGSSAASTDRTGGRQEATALQDSPESADAKSCPPVVSTYTPAGSRESVASASRRTFT